MKFKKEHGSLIFVLGKLRLELKHPTVCYKKNIYGLWFPTTLVFRNENKWCWHSGASLQILGFGVGYVWKHYQDGDWQTNRNGVIY